MLYDKIQYNINTYPDNKIKLIYLVQAITTSTHSGSSFVIQIDRSWKSGVQHAAVAFYTHQLGATPFGIWTLHMEAQALFSS